MSAQVASEFMNRVVNDESLREKLFQRQGTAEERVNIFVEVGREHGFIFGPEDVGSLLTSVRKPDGTLNELQLAQAVGGMSTFYKWLGIGYSWLGGGGGGDSGGQGTVGVRG